MTRLAFLLWVVFSLWSAEAASQVDIIDQRVVLDLRGLALKATLTLEIKAGVAAASRLIITAPAVPITSAALSGGTVSLSSPAPTPGQPLVLDFFPALPAGDTAELILELEGEPACGTCVWSHELKYLLPSWAGVWWYAYSLAQWDAFVGEVEITVPANQVAAAGEGAPLSVTINPDGSVTSRFAFTHPSDQLFFYAGAVQRVESTTAVPAEGLFLPGAGREAVMTGAVDLAGRLAQVYGEFAAVDPVDQVRVVIVPDNTAFGGFGMLGTVFLTEAFLADKLDQLDQGVAHELAHTWWGNLASAPFESPELRFLHESFAEYTTWRGLGRLFGDERRTAGSRMNAVFYMYRRPLGQDVALLDPGITTSPVWIHVAYHKGSVVLRTFEEGTGEKAWDGALRALLTNGYRGLSALGLLDALKAQGVDLGTLAQQWLLQEGFPTVTVTTMASPATRTSASPGEITLAVRAEATVGYDLDLPLVIQDASGARVKRTLTTVGQGLSESFLRRPVLIEVDPRWTMVREVRPALAGDVSMDGRVDAVDLVEVALRLGGVLPDKRRVDGGYDPLYDLDRDQTINEQDLAAVVSAAVQP